MIWIQSSKCYTQCPVASPQAEITCHSTHFILEVVCRPWKRLSNLEGLDLPLPIGEWAPKRGSLKLASTRWSPGYCPRYCLPALGELRKGRSTWKQVLSGGSKQEEEKEREREKERSHPSFLSPWGRLDRGRDWWQLFPNTHNPLDNWGKSLECWLWENAWMDKKTRLINPSTESEESMPCDGSAKCSDK